MAIEMKKIVITIPAVAAATAVVLGSILYRYIFYHQPLTWNDLPLLTLKWIFFAVGFFVLQELRLKWREKRRSA